MSDQNQIAVTETKVIDWVGRLLPELSGYRARSFDENQWKMSVVIAVLENPSLMSAMTTDVGRRSIHSALRRAVSMGLSLNPQEGKACLVPYKDKIQYQIMKDGYIDLLLSTGAVKFVRVGTVYKNDGWESWEAADSDGYKLSPARGDRGAIDLFFAAATLNDGSCILKQISAEQAAEHRKAYSQHSQLLPKEYGEKTVAKMLCRSSKIASIAPVVTVALEKEEEEREEIDVTPPPKKTEGTAENVAETLKAKQTEGAEPEPEKKPGPDGELDIF